MRRKGEAQVGQARGGHRLVSKVLLVDSDGKGWSSSLDAPRAFSPQRVLDCIRKGEYSRAVKNLVTIYRALADETRLRILALLLSESELCVCDIIAATRLPQSTISRHLAYLRKAGLVNDRRCGFWIYYSIRDGGDAQKELLSLLKNQLPSERITVKDREQLACLGEGNRCA